jgi:tetratricopeptide (TPR) repeat protein
VRMTEGGIAEAAELFARAVRAAPAMAVFHCGLGEALLRLGRGEEALESFAAAVRAEPGSADAHAGHAAALQALGRQRESDASLRRSLLARLRGRDGAPAATHPPRPVPGTTLVCADCSNHELAADAVARTLARCSFERAVFFTDTAIEVRGAEIVRIAPLRSVQDYSRFMLKDLCAHVSTPYVLVIQYDGYVLDARRWTDEFQQYDYVGARWPGPNRFDVGNGGFSLRSRRLLEALQDPAIEVQTPEDVAICRTYRPLLEARHGLRFAPAEIAGRFSFEALTPVAPTFGFHGLSHLFRLFDMDEAGIAAYRPEPMTLTTRDEEILRN